MRRSAKFLALCCAIGSPALADEVLFSNGDRLTGTIVSATDGKLTIKSAVAGEVTVDMAAVKTFSTDKAIELHLKDGSVLKQPVAAAPDGQIATAGSPEIKAQSVPIASVTQINPPAAPPVVWTGSIVANAMLTRGNTDTDSLGMTLDAMRRATMDRITLKATYLYGRQEDPDTGDMVVTTDNWLLMGKYDYFFNKKFYAYGITTVERDRIAELDLRLAPGGGVGYQWHESPKWNFFTEAGLNWVYEKYENSDESESHFAARFAYHYDRRLSDDVTLFHNLEYLPSVEDLGDFNLNTDMGVRFTLVKNMFGEVKAELRHDATPAPGAEKNDVRYILGLGWKF